MDFYSLNKVLMSSLGANRNSRTTLRDKRKDLEELARKIYDTTKLWCDWISRYGRKYRSER